MVTQSQSQPAKEAFACVKARLNYQPGKGKRPSTVTVNGRTLSID